MGSIVADSQIHEYPIGNLSSIKQQTILVIAIF
jgi:hypothetical protein